MSTSSVAVTAGDSRSLTSEATGRSSSASSNSNTSRRGSTSTSQPAPMSLQRSQSINIRDLFNASNPENDFYVPEVFDAMDEGMELEEAFIEAQRAALAAINDAALAKAIQESEREAALGARSQRSRSIEPSRLADPKYALVSPSELGRPSGRNHGRPISSATASTTSGSTSASTAASSVMSSSVPKTATPIQSRPSPVKSVSAPAVATASSSAMRSPSSNPYSPPKVPVIPASAPTSSLSASRPSASSPSKSFINTSTATVSTKATTTHQISNQASPYLGSTPSSSGTKSISMDPASESGLSRKAPAPSSTAPVAQPLPISGRSPTHLTSSSSSSSLSSSSAMAPRTSTSPSAKDLAMGVMSSTSALSSDLNDVQPSRQHHNIRQRLKCSRCSGSTRVKCRCPLSYLLAVEHGLASFDKEFVALVTGDSLSRETTEKQRQLFLARVLLRNEMATRPFESIAIKTLDSLQKLLVGLKDVTSAFSSSDDSDSSDSPEFDCPSSLDLHLYLQSLISASLIPSFIHFFLSHPNAQDWMKFADLYIGILTFLRRMVESGGGSILNEPLVVVDRRYHNSGLTSSAVSSIWDVVLNRLERQTRPELIKATAAIKFGGTMDKVNRMCDGIMWLVLQDLTDD